MYWEFAPAMNTAAGIYAESQSHRGLALGEQAVNGNGMISKRHMLLKLLRVYTLFSFIRVLFMLSPSNYETEMHHFTIGSYNVISDNKFCGHGQGGLPFYCRKLRSEVSNCEIPCVEFDDCVAYAANPNRCYLFPSSRNCPSGWETKNQTLVAVSSNDIVPSEHSGYFCRAKKGKIIHINSESEIQQ